MKANHWDRIFLKFKKREYHFQKKNITIAVYIYTIGFFEETLKIMPERRGYNKLVLPLHVVCKSEVG